MEKFVAINNDELNTVKSRFNRIVGDIPIEGQNAFDAFLFYINELNHAIANPESIHESNQTAFALQEEYNAALVVSKVRWEKSKKELDVGASAIKDLLARKNAFEAAMAVAQMVEAKQQKIDAFSNFENPNSHKESHSPWFILNQAAMDLDKIDKGTRVESIKTLRINYQSQGILAKYNASDLLKLQKEINNFEVFLKYIENKFKRQFKNKKNNTIISFLKTNRTMINRYRTKIDSAIAWRLKAAKFSQDLHCDDGLYPLFYSLNNEVFVGVQKDSLKKIQDIINIPETAISHTSSFDIFNQMLKISRSSSKKNALSQWLKDVIINEKNKKIIPVTLKEGWIIPSKLKDFVPDKPSFTLDSWVRYWFFKTHAPLKGFWGWLRKKLIGSYSETAILINETYAQLNHFVRNIPTKNKKSEVQDLLEIVQSSAFKSALELPYFIAMEKKRAHLVAPSWFFGRLLGWIPFINRSQSYHFFQIWHQELNTAQKEISKKARVLTSHIIIDFENALQKCIVQRSFIAEPKIVSDLDKFIKHYASRQQYLAFSKMISPRQILDKFDFLLPKNKKDKYARIDDDAIFSFLHFAQKYWPQAQISAAQKIVNLLLKEKFPQNESDDQKWMSSVECFLESDNIKQSYKEMMSLIAKKYIFGTGDSGNHQSYQFLKRFYPAGAKQWKLARQEDIQSKYAFINYLLSVPASFEKNLASDAFFEIDKKQFLNKNYSRYLQDLTISDEALHTKNILLLQQQAQVYLQRFEGENVNYLGLIYKLCSPKSEIFAQYCQKRLSWLIKETNLGNPINMLPQEYQSYFYMPQNHKFISTICEQIDNEYTGENNTLSEVIDTINHPKVSAAYYAKHLLILLEKRDYQAILDVKSQWDKLQKNTFFVKKTQEIIAQHLRRIVSEKDSRLIANKALNEVVENIGSLQNKECYRLLRVKKLLHQNDFDVTKEYLKSASLILQPCTVQEKLLSLPESKALLNQIYQDHLNNLTKKQWLGHTQFFLETFVPLNNNQLIYDIRLRWLTAYLSHPELFAHERVLERSSLDAKYHHQNILIPTNEISLENFYGKANLDAVVQALMNRLDDSELKLSDAGVRLMQKYINDKAIAANQNASLLASKLSYYQQCQRIGQSISTSKFPEAILQLEGLWAAIQANELLNNKKELAKRKVAYQNRLFDQMTQVFSDAVKDQILNPKRIKKIMKEEPLKNQLRVSQRELDIYQRLQASTLPDKVKIPLNILHQQSQALVPQVVEFVSNLHFNHLHLIQLDEQQAMLFRSSLSKKTRQFIEMQITIAKSYLRAEDPLYQALSAFVRLLNKDYHHLDFHDKDNDIEKMNVFKNLKANYPKMAQEVANKLIEALDKHRSLLTFDLFSDKRTVSQRAFLNYLTKDVRVKLLKSLKSKIDWMYAKAIPSQIVEQKQDWLNHGKLYRWLIDIDAHDENVIQSKIERQVTSYLQASTKTLALFYHKIDLITASKHADFSKLNDNEFADFLSTNLVEEQQALLKMAIYIRSFGRGAQLKQLDNLLDEVSRRLRRAVMRGVSGLHIEHCMNFANKLVVLAGTIEQKTQSGKLTTQWHHCLAQEQRTGLASIRCEAVNASISPYVAEIDRGVYQYFVTKFNMDENFHEKMFAKLESWGLKHHLVEPHELLKEKPLTRFLKILNENVRERTDVYHHLVGSHVPNMKDATKLYVALCISMHAHQLAHLWHVRNRKSGVAMKEFKPEFISHPLNELVHQLLQEYKIGAHDFSRSIYETLAKDNDYFVSWTEKEANTDAVKASLANMQSKKLKKAKRA